MELRGLCPLRSFKGVVKYQLLNVIGSFVFEFTATFASGGGSNEEDPMGSRFQSPMFTFMMPLMGPFFLKPIAKGI